MTTINNNEIINSINTISDLCNYLNANGDYSNSIVDAVIERNGWIDMQTSVYDVCRTKEGELLYMREDGIFDTCIYEED